jgi:uncharacterized caspase-like protein
LLVRVTNYSNAALRPLKYTENDVKELAKLLLCKASGFDEMRVLSPTRGKKDKADLPTTDNIEKAIDDLVQKKERHDTILIGLSGHGVQLEMKEPDEKGSRRRTPTSAPATPVNYSTGLSKNLILLDDLFAVL